MQSHEQRVVDEEKELRSKITALSNFLNGEIIKSLPKCEQILLDEQHIKMSAYRDVLLRRINLFKD